MNTETVTEPSTDTPAKTRFNFAKTVATSVAGMSAGFVVKELIKTNLTVATGSIPQIKLAVGVVVLGGIAANAARTHVGTQMDDAMESWNEFQAKRAEKKAETENVVHNITTL